MSSQASRFLALSIGIFSFLVLVPAGCCPQCGGDRCLPRSPWQSPTIQATHTLLVVNQDDLRILCIDGNKALAMCVGQGGVREYHLHPGEHTFQAVFRYDAPPGEGVLADTKGYAVTRTCSLLAGHEYVAFYNEHPGPVPEDEACVAPVATNVFNPPQLYWCLEVVDLAEPEVDGSPEVREARTYTAWVKGTSETLGK